MSYVASGFRKCIVAAPDCLLVEADFSAIEAVLTGYFMDDPNYMRLARIGIHTYLTSHLVGKPVDFRQPDLFVLEELAKIKDACKTEYARAKRVVHGTNYGLTPIGMVNNYPEFFTRSSASKIQNLYYDLCPKLKPWQDQVRLRAHKQGFLGGSDHPFRYKHYFWDVFTWNSKTKSYSLGSDANKVVAFYPQSTAAGVIYEASLRLVEDAKFATLFYGKTPIRALIHDSILCEVPENRLEDAYNALHREMTKPVPQLGGLSFGVAVKVGKNWGEMKEFKPAS
jgi:DNA polymerase I-like protein with 3'-5' exonuclease and polymerase domains